MKTSYFEKRALDSISNILTYWDKDLICRFANDAFTSWYGIKNADLVDKMTAKEVFGPLFELNLPYWEKAMQGVKQEFRRKITLQNGETRHVLALYIPDFVRDKVVGIVVQVFDITRLQTVEDELVQAKAKAEYLATHDHLTGLLNRFLLNDRMANSLLVAERTKQKIAICMIDIDNFKTINDSFGHQAGDAVLRLSAARFEATLREYDSIARFGGDEFVILLSTLGHGGELETILQRLLQASAQPIQLENNTIHSSISLGVAVYPDDGITGEALLIMADQALYKAKAQGKNCYAFFNQPA